MSSKLNHGVFAVIAQAEGDELRQSMFANLAMVRKVSVETLEAEFTKYVTENAKALERERKRAETEARKVRVEALVKQGEGMTFESEGLAEFITAVEAEGGVVKLTPKLKLAVVVKLPKAGGKSGGKPANWAPQPYRDSEGDRICGPLTNWAKENLSEGDQKEAGCFRPNGKFRTGESLAKALIKAEVITADPVSTEEMAAAKAAHEAAENAS